MDRTEQTNDEQTPVISPLANEKTYGERVYSRVFDWGLNYWTNLLASAGFSQWAEHGTKPIKLWGMKKAESPRELQQDLAAFIRKKDPFMRSFEKKMFAEKSVEAAKAAVFDRSMARARSLTLLMPGFAVMIPAVWLGAKIKPWFVEKLNRRHYGDEAMDDPSLIARQQAVIAEDRPTLMGTVIARFGTVFAVQAVAQTVGSHNNLINKLGEKSGNKSMQKFGIDSFTESVGASLGGALPAGTRDSFNIFARRHGLNHSEHQIKKLKRSGPYNTASEDLGRFVVADTVYTLVTALTIRPFVKLLRHVPFMSYKPKVAANSPVFDSDGNKIKVPANRYADEAMEPAANDGAYGKEGTAALARAEDAANDATVESENPGNKVSKVHGHAMLANKHEPQIAGAGV